MKKNKRKVSVIGSGIGGLAIAVRLAVNGFDVKVFDSNKIMQNTNKEFSLSIIKYTNGTTVMIQEGKEN